MRRSRSASACLAIARTMVLLRSTSLISIVVTLMPLDVDLPVEALLGVGVQLVSFREHLVELMFAKY